MKMTFEIDTDKSAQQIVELLDLFKMRIILNHMYVEGHEPKGLFTSYEIDSIVQKRDCIQINFVGQD